MSTLHPISGCDNANRKADVIFIHGLGGDAYKTWRNSNHFFWPVWIGKEFSEVGVWSLDYPASPSRWGRIAGWLSKHLSDAGRTMALPDRALQVLDRMVQCGLGERPILFVCHSLGGLLAKQILRNSFDATDARKRQVVTQTSALLFLATPHSGSELASLFNAFSLVFGTTVSIEELRAHDAHLRELYNWYRNHAPGLGIQTVTYYEQRPVKVGLSIVNPTSAHPGVGADPVPLDEDHISIARPESGTAQVCSSVCDLLRNTVLAQRLAPSVEQPPNVLPHEPHEITIKIDPSMVSGSATRRVPHELPPAAERFFGRKTEEAQLTERLREGKNTAVSGLAGLGKTALAAKSVLQVVGATPAELAASPYPDGVVFLDLYAFHAKAEEAWHTLANKLAGADFRANAQARERAEEACRARRILVIIEGGEEADGKDGRCTIPVLFSVLSPENRWLLLTRLTTQAAGWESVQIKEALQHRDAADLFDALCKGRVTGSVRDRVLELLEGHPLALTWACNLVARDDENPEQLVREWEHEQLPSLRDPVKADHTLEWIFNRSVFGLDHAAQLALGAAGLLARAPFPLSAIETALEETHPGFREHSLTMMKSLAQCGILRRQDDLWQFTHVLGYRFARKESGSDPAVRVALGLWLRSHLAALLMSTAGEEETLKVTTLLQHVTALLRTDDDQQLWFPLAQYLLYDASERLVDMGRLVLVQQALDAVRDWFDQFPDEMSGEHDWLRERSVLLNKRADVLSAQGDLAGALTAYRESLRVRERLASSDPSNATWQRDLSYSFTQQATCHEQQGSRSEALHYAELSLEIDRRLASLDITNVMWQNDLAVSQALVERLKSGASNAK